jgi:hypothetical protein
MTGRSWRVMAMNSVATYKEIAASVKTFDGMTVKTCWMPT